MLPLSVKKTRVRPAISLDWPEKGALFSTVWARVMRLMPSPLVPAGLIDCALEVVSTNLMLAASDQCESARRKAPPTSLPGLMLAGGAKRDGEKAMVMVLPGHLI
jgi:hypothetical protein